MLKPSHSLPTCAYIHICQGVTSHTVVIIWAVYLLTWSNQMYTGQEVTIKCCGQPVLSLIFGRGKWPLPSHLSGTVQHPLSFAILSQSIWPWTCLYEMTLTLGYTAITIDIYICLKRVQFTMKNSWKTQEHHCTVRLMACCCHLITLKPIKMSMYTTIYNVALLGLQSSVTFRGCRVQNWTRIGFWKEW